MKKQLAVFLLSFALVSCLSEEQQQEIKNNLDSGAADTEAVIDTFSVKRAPKLSAAEQKALDSTNAEAKQIVNDAASIMTEGSPGGSDLVSNPNGYVKNPDIGASYPGGEDAMEKYLAKRTVYPLVAFENRIKGTVLLRVVIESDGKVGGITVQKGLGYGCDEAAQDAVRGMPNWIPAKKNGVAVRTVVVIPVSFGNNVDN